MKRKETYLKMKNKMKKYILFLISVAVFNTSCILGKKFTDPEVDTPEEYLTKLTDSLDSIKPLADSLMNDTLVLNWWDLFGDSLLDTLVLKGLANNRNILATLSKLEQSRINVGFNRANTLPKFSYAISGQRGNFMMQALPNPANNFFTTGNVSWEIDLFGKYKSLTKAAQTNFIGQQYNLRAVQIALISEISTNYFKLLDFQERLRVSKKTLESRDSILSIISQRFEEGIVGKIDLTQAQIQREIAAISVPLFENSIRQTKNNISFLLGENPKELETYLTINEKEIKDIPMGLPSTVLETRPDLLKAKMDLKAQNYMVSNAIGQQFPTISLTGALGLASNTLNTLTTNPTAWNIGAGLLGPIFEFGKNRKRKQIEQEKTKQLLYVYEEKTINAFREIENQLSAIQSLKQQLIAVEKYKEAAIEAEMLSEQRYDKGVTSYLEVLQNQKSALESQIRYAETKQQLLNAYVALYKSLGGGYITPEEYENDK